MTQKQFNEQALEASSHQNEWELLQECPNGAIYRYKGLRIFANAKSKELMIIED